jgi:hypothetical protein
MPATHPVARASCKLRRHDIARVPSPQGGRR